MNQTLHTLCRYALLGLFSTSTALFAEEIGSVNTAFVLLGANHKIVIEAFDDPKIPGVSCHLSRAKTGGVKGTLGIAEDTSDASIACRQTGIIVLPSDVQQKKVMVNVSLKSPLRCCLNTFKWCVFMMQNVTRSFICRILINSSMDHQKMLFQRFKSPIRFLKSNSKTLSR